MRSVHIWVEVKSRLQENQCSRLELGQFLVSKSLSWNVRQQEQKSTDSHLHKTPRKMSIHPSDDSNSSSKVSSGNMEKSKEMHFYPQSVSAQIRELLRQRTIWIRLAPREIEMSPLWQFMSTIKTNQKSANNFHATERRSSSISGKQLSAFP